MDFSTLDTGQIVPWLTTLGFAIGILVVTWVLATIAKGAFARLLDRVPFIKGASTGGETIGTSIGRILSLFIWLFGLIALLQLFGLNNVIAPLQTLLNKVMAAIPNILGAALIFFVGLMVARIVKQLVERLVATANLSHWTALGRAKVEKAVDVETGGVAEPVTTGVTFNQLGSTLGTLAFVFIIIPVAIAALQQLGISSITAPATEMLEMVLTAIPRVLGAGIVLGLGWLIAGWVAGLIRSVLPATGIDGAVKATGLLPASASASGVAATVVTVALMLFAGVAATRMLGFPELTAILDQLLVLGGRVLLGSIVIGVGVILSNVIARVVSFGTGGAGFAPTMIRYVIIGVATFMGLTFMQIGEQIVVIAFTAFVGAAAVATAVAFGLGGRETAHKLLERWTDKTPPTL